MSEFESVNKLSEWLDSIEGQSSIDEYLKEIEIKTDLDKSRFDKFEVWLKTNSFDDLMNRLYIEHSEEYREKCYKKGYEPYCNNKLSFIFNYVSNRVEQIIDKSIEDYNFNTEMYFFKGYIFVTIFGQGAFNRIYKDNKLFLQV